MTGRDRLDVIYINPAGGCNLHCRHCWVNEGGTMQGTMPLETWEHLLMEASEMGCGGVKLTGGEPLLYRDIVPLYRFAGERFDTVVLETNGTLRPEGMFQAMEEFPPLQVSVSIDSADERVHDEFRGVKGAWRNAVFFTEELVHRKIATQIIMSISGTEREPVEKMVDLVKRTGAGSLKINFITPVGRGSENSFYSGIQIREAMDFFRWIHHELPEWVLPSLPAALVPVSRLANLGYCPVRNLIGVLPDGTFSLCGVGFSRADMAWGRYPGTSVREAWENSPVLREIRNSLPEELTGVCSKCIHRDSCIGRCVVANRETSGSLRSPDILCETAFREGLFPETRLKPT